MDKNQINEFFNIMNMYKVSLYALKWMESNNNKNYEPIIIQNEYLMNKLQEYCINNIGIPEDL